MQEIDTHQPEGKKTTLRRWNHQLWPNRKDVELPELSDFQMIIFDIDGTLLDIEGFQEELIPLIRKIEQLGYTISLASGRTLPNVTPIQQSLAVSGFVVGENGGMVWDTHAGFPIQALADGRRAREAANWLAGEIDGLDPAGIESNRWRETEWCLKEIGNYEVIRDAIAASQYNDLSVVPTGFAIHLCIPGLDKSTGVDFALKQRGIDPSRVIAVGDAANDIPMFELCGFAVAVNDEHNGVADAADIITEQKGTSGTIEFLKQFIQAVEIP